VTTFCIGKKWEINLEGRDVLKKPSFNTHLFKLKLNFHRYINLTKLGWEDEKKGTAQKPCSLI